MVADHDRSSREDRATSATVPGHATIEFDTPVVNLSIPTTAGATVRTEGNRVTISAPDPGATLAPWLFAHPDATRHLRSIEVHPPTLDDLYRHLVHP